MARLDKNRLHICKLYFAAFNGCRSDALNTMIAVPGLSAVLQVTTSGRVDARFRELELLY